MINGLVVLEAIVVDVIDLSGPLEIIEVRPFIRVFYPPPLQEGILNISIASLHYENRTAFSPHGLLPSVQVPAFLLDLLIVRRRARLAFFSFDLFLFVAKRLQLGRMHEIKLLPILVLTLEGGILYQFCPDLLYSFPRHFLSFWLVCSKCA